MARQSKTKGAVERSIPVVYFILALLLAVLVLPSVLRPPNQQPSQTAELSPDAPPSNQDTIVAQFNRGSSGTAGAGEGEGASDTPGPGGTGPGGGPGGIAPAAVAPRACVHGFGNPARQTESPYAPPCATAWNGNNGGATWKGVTGSEVRIILETNGGGGSTPANKGEVSRTPRSNDNAADRTLRVWQEYFNENFQSYGRYIKFIVQSPGGNNEANEKAQVVNDDAQWKPFAMTLGTSIEADEFARRGTVVFPVEDGASVPQPFYTNHAPYAWSFWMNGMEVADFGVEALCKKLAGKLATHAGDPTMQTQTRVFGLLYNDSRGWQEQGAYFQDKLKRACGVEPVVSIGENLDGEGQGNAGAGASFGTAVARMRSAGVNTVIVLSDFVSNVAFTNAADSQQWYPEWYIPGGWGNDDNGLAQLENSAEWAHAFGVSSIEIPQSFDQTPCVRAYHTIDPDNDPNFVLCRYYYMATFLAITGIQMAGPNLNPSTFAEGLHKLGMRYYDHPSWALGGGFAPGVFTYPHNVSEIWWDVSASDPEFAAGGNAQPVGAYRFVHAGKRYCLGDLPAEDLFFKDGETTPPDSADYNATPPRSDCPRY